MSENNKQLCRFCQRQMRLTYYCEGCGASCCSDCLIEERIDYYVCNDCNSKSIEILDSEGRKACKDCNGENIIKVSQPIKSCPKCHSHRIINIYEKKEELEQKFLEIIKNLRLFVDPLRELINKMNVLREKVKKARDPPIRCYHFPRMEADLLALFKLFIQVKNDLLEKMNVHLHHLAINKEYFFNIYDQPSSNITIIEGILENLNRSYESISEFVKNKINTITENIESHQINLQFIDKISVYFSTYKAFLSLAEAEKPVFAINAKLINGLNNQEIFRKKRGILFVTNLDLSFVHEFGTLKKKQELILKAPVNDLTRIKEKGKVFKKLYMEFAYGKYEFSLPTNAVKKVIEYIILARTFDETVKKSIESAKKLNEIEVNLDDLTNFIEEGINSFFSLKCIYNKKIEVDQRKNYYKDINYNEKIAQNINYHPNPPQYRGFMNEPQYNSYQSQDMSNSFPKKPFYPYPNYNQVPLNSQHYREGTFPPHARDPRIQPFENPSYPGYPVNNMRQAIPPNYNENGFNFQNLFNPNRFQNYEPQRYNNPYCNQDSDLEEKNLLMKKLEQAQKYSQRFPNQNYDFNNDLSRPPILNKENDSWFDQNVNLHNRQRSFQQFNKNHLSDFFKQNNAPMIDPYAPMIDPYASKEDLFEENRENRKKMQELKKEKYSLKETLKKLEAKFDSGILSEVEYFRKFKNFHKELYSINTKIESLTDKLKKKEKFLKKNKRNFNDKRYGF